MTIEDLHYMTYEGQKVVIECKFHEILFAGIMKDVNSELMKKSIFWIEASGDKLIVEVYL